MLPKVIIYNAVSLDGNIGPRTVDMNAYYGLVPVWREDATLAGSRTILKGAGEVPPERPGDLRPWKVDPKDGRALLVVPDSQGRVRIWHYLRKAGYWRDVVALCSRATPARYLEYLKKRHIDSIITGATKVDLKVALERLRSDYGVRTVRVDSGGILNGVLLRKGLVDEVSLLIHPELVGGKKAMSFYSGPVLPEGAITLKLIRMERIKSGLVWVRYKVVR